MVGQGESGPSFAERQEKKRTAWVKRCLVLDPKLSYFPRPTKKRKKNIYTTLIIYDYSSQSNKCDRCCCSFDGVDRNTKQFTID